MDTIKRRSHTRNFKSIDGIGSSLSKDRSRNAASRDGVDYHRWHQEKRAQIRKETSLDEEANL